MACHRLDMTHLYSLLITKLPPSWEIAISGDRTIQLLFSLTRNVLCHNSYSAVLPFHMRTHAMCFFSSVWEIAMFNKTI